MAPQDPFTELARPVKTYHKKSYERISTANSQFQGKGKTVLVTGGATGIGLAICQAFAEVGTSRIVILSRSIEPQLAAKKLLEAINPACEVVLYQVSITDDEGVTKVMQEVGSIDVLVLCAAAGHADQAKQHKSTERNLEEIRQIFEGNVHSMFHFIKTYLELRNPPRGRRTVINISSVAGQMVIPNMIGYGASKAAGTMILRSFAAEYDPNDVAMFSIHPGAHLTPLAAKSGFTADSFAWDDIQLPADFCVWLATPEAEFLHGRTLWPHWDVDELLALKEKVAKDPTFLTQGLVL